MEKQYTFTKSETADKEIVLTIKVAPEKFVAAKEKMFNKMSQEVKLPGFRPGKAPKALIEAQISEAVYNETINSLLPEVTSSVLQETKHTPMNQIKYELVKMSDAEGMEYKATFINYPEVKLGDVSKIKVKKETKEVTAKDVEAEITKIFSYYTKKDAPKEGADKDKKEEAPEVTDASVKALGIGFETVTQLKEQIKKELESLAGRDNEAKWLQEVLNEAVKISKVEVPQALVKQSVAGRESDYLKKLEELKLKLDEFLKVQNTTMDKLKEEWTKEAKQKFAEELVLLEIIKEQKITVTDTDITHEIEHVTDEKLKSELDSPEGKRYIVTVLLQQKAIQWLREQVQK